MGPTRGFLLPVPGPYIQEDLSLCMVLPQLCLEKSVLGFLFISGGPYLPQMVACFSLVRERPHAGHGEGWELQVRVQIL